MYSAMSEGTTTTALIADSLIAAKIALFTVAPRQRFKDAGDIISDVAMFMTSSFLFYSERPADSIRECTSVLVDDQHLLCLQTTSR